MTELRGYIRSNPGTSTRLRLSWSGKTWKKASSGLRPESRDRCRKGEVCRAEAKVAIESRKGEGGQITMHYVYIIKAERYAGKYYVGYSENMDERLQAHNNGQSIHTAKYQPWKLVCYMAFVQKEQALKFETYLKSGSGRAFAKKHF